MFKILVAQKNAQGRWKKVGVFLSTDRGVVSVPPAHRGQMTGYVMRKAAEFLAVEKAAEGLDFADVPTGPFRATRI